MLTREQALKHLPQIEKTIDLARLALAERKDTKGGLRTTWTADDSASRAENLLLDSFQSVIYVLPELHFADLLSGFKPTQFRPTEGLFTPYHVRMPCPVCISNLRIVYSHVRVLTLHGLDKKRKVVDWACFCSSKNCPAVISNVIEHNI